MSQSVVGQGIKIFTVDVFGGILGFPVWWYSKGLVRFFRFGISWFNDYRAWLGVSIWIKNIFVPMYGSYDIAGRLVSFFMRVVMIVLRSIALVFILLMMLAMMLIYVALPPLVVVMILYHGFGLALSPLNLR